MNKLYELADFFVALLLHPKILLMVFGFMYLIWQPNLSNATLAGIVCFAASIVAPRQVL